MQELKAHKERKIAKDAKYDNYQISKFINYIMKDGKKIAKKNSIPSFRYTKK